MRRALSTLTFVLGIPFIVVGTLIFYVGDKCFAASEWLEDDRT